MTALQQAAWDEILRIQVYLAAGLILIVTLGLVQNRLWLRRHPTVGALIGYALLVASFLLYKMSPFNSDARMLFSSGLLALAVSVIASIIISDPPVKEKNDASDDLDKAIDIGMDNFKRQIGEVKAAKMAPLHRKMKLNSIFNEFQNFLAAVKRIKAQEEST